MKRFVQGECRTQSTLLPELLDDYITENNPARVVDVFVDELDLGKLGFEGIQPALTGRPSYHPAVLLKLYIYGYLNFQRVLYLVRLGMFHGTRRVLQASLGERLAIRNCHRRPHHATALAVRVSLGVIASLLCCDGGIALCFVFVATRATLGLGQNIRPSGEVGACRATLSALLAKSL